MLSAGDARGVRPNPRPDEPGRVRLGLGDLLRSVQIGYAFDDPGWALILGPGVVAVTFLTLAADLFPGRRTAPPRQN